jgi:hypothetical protein
VKCKCHRSGAAGADAADLLPLGLVGAHDGCQCPESIQKSLSSHGRDAGYGCECRLSGGHSRETLCPLRVPGTAPRVVGGAALCKTMEPLRRVGQTVRSNDRYTQVQGRSFDQQIRETRNTSKTTNLRPERAFDDRKMETPYRLPFDQRSVADFVVSSPEHPPDHRHAQVLEMGMHRIGLPAVDRDLSHLGSIQANVCRVSAETVSKLQQLALSRSESA